MRQFLAIAFLVCLGTVGLKADFTYEQTATITGGMMASMMKMAGTFSKTAREPIKSTIIVKGNRMVTLSRDAAHIINLETETITDVNFSKKTYSVITFAQMAEAMKRLTKEAPTTKPGDTAEFKASITDGHQSKVINGMDAKLMILALEIESKDPKSGQTGTMVMTSEMWLAASVPGYNEVRDFHIRMAKKINWSADGGFASMGGAEMAKAMKGLAAESAKLDGVPVLQVTHMGMKGEPPTAEGQSGMDGNQPAKPNASDAAAGAATSSAASRLGGLAGGLAGGLGGFGKKKKVEEKPPAEPTPAPATAPPSASQAAAGTPSSLMVMNTELTSFSATADASKFDVPAGFKQVESDMLKAGKK